MSRAEAVKAAEAEGGGGGGGTAVRYSQLVAEGLEDDAELVDKATDADRDWDTFKEANPKGWGNKHGKRF